LGLAVVIAGYYLSQNPATLDEGLGTLQQSQPGLYVVEEASDGDTIIVNMGGRREIVRMIGIDTPETHHPDRPVQCYGREASEYARLSLVEKQVRLEADPLNTNRDRYDRLLRYVYLPDGGLFNAKVIQEGYGFSYTSFPFSKAEEFETYEHQAQQTKKGLWGRCAVSTEPNGIQQTNPAH
jgi:micrococcal nuclease